MREGWVKKEASGVTSRDGGVDAASENRGPIS